MAEKNADLIPKEALRQTLFDIFSLVHIYFQIPNLLFIISFTKVWVEGFSDWGTGFGMVLILPFSIAFTLALIPTIIYLRMKQGTERKIRIVKFFLTICLIPEFLFLVLLVSPK